MAIKTLAQHLGEFAATLRFDALPPAALAVAKSGLSDCIAVMVAGSREPAAQALRKTLAALGGNAESTLYFSGERMAAPAAAWINSTAGHVLDYDDVALGHPSVVIVPAILAEGEALDASGADLLTAYVTGFETWMELITRERDNYQMKGWHPTPLIGALAAAAACANLRRLDANAATSAWGVRRNYKASLAVTGNALRARRATQAMSGLTVLIVLLVIMPIEYVREKRQSRRKSEKA